MKLYVVSEIGYEYNDEIHYPTESDDGLPVRVFRRRENAEKHAQKLNEQAIREHEGDEDWQDYEGEPITNFYRVDEVDADDSEILEKP
jgi:hypothetical protein